MKYVITCYQLGQLVNLYLNTSNGFLIISMSFSIHLIYILLIFEILCDKITRKSKLDNIRIQKCLSTLPSFFYVKNMYFFINLIY